jgi:hypothetical protein
LLFPTPDLLNLRNIRCKIMLKEREKMVTCNKLQILKKIVRERNICSIKRSNHNVKYTFLKKTPWIAVAVWESKFG